MMIRHPGWHIVAEATDDTGDVVSAEPPGDGDIGEIEARIREVLSTLRTQNFVSSRSLSVVVRSTIPFHCGFGAGTQLSLATAMAATLLDGRPRPDATALSVVLGRSQRSAIGTFGFEHGGCLIDDGEGVPSDRSRVCAVPVPDSWRLVIVRRTDRSGLHGSGERAVFAQELQMAPDDLNRMQCLIHDAVIPALHEGDFGTFAAELERYGRIVGEFFASAQGSCFSDPLVHDIADALHARQLPGPVQSSWGPAVAVPADSMEHAEEIVRVVQSAAGNNEVVTRITEPLPHGATIRSTAPEQCSYRTLG